MSSFGEHLHHQLDHDHQRQDFLLHGLFSAVRAQDSREMLRLWSELREGLFEHMRLEEEKLIPRLYVRHQPEAQALTAEHEEVRGMLREIERAVGQGSLALQMLYALEDLLLHHRVHEARLFYPWADLELTGSEKGEVVRDLLEHARSRWRGVR